MFDERKIKAYKNITAPDELRERILNAPQTSENSGLHKHSITHKVCRLAATAAGLMLVVGLPIFMLNKDSAPEVSFNGQQLTAEKISVSGINFGASVASTRSCATAEIPLELDIDRPTEISLTGGIMKILQPDTDSSLYNGINYTTDCDVSIQWSIDALETSQKYCMTLDDNKNTFEITLSFDEAAGEWNLSCEKE